MSGMDDLVTWLRAQLDEDERVAREVIAQVGTERDGDPYDDGSGTADRDSFPSYPWGQHAEELAFMAAPGHPARVLAEVEAKRRIVEAHTPAVLSDPLYGCPTCWEGVEDGGPMDTPCPTLRLLGMPYADRPGYREEWRP